MKNCVLKATRRNFHFVDSGSPFGQEVKNETR